MKLNRLKFAFAALVAVAATGIAVACPFCSVETQTLSEETRGADAVVLARLVKEAPPTANPADPNSGTATFQIVETLRGQDAVKDTKEISVVFFGDSNRDKTYLVNGIGKDKIDWTTPLPLSEAAVKYVKQLSTIPESGADRLAFFQESLENPDPLLAQDSYDEFARAPYADLKNLKARMPHDRIIKWVQDPEVSPSRRRLYLTMLGICGTKNDVPMLEQMIASDFDAMKPALEDMSRTAVLMGGPIGLPVWIDAVQQEERRKKLGLDALVACYLILRGPDGLDLVENRFLKNPHAEYTHVYSTIMALRFHGDENTGVLPKERLLSSMRLLLNNQDFADQVILDLSRWEDWSVMDRIVEMFKNSDAKGYVRQPVVSYLTVASEQPGDVGTRAKAALAELERLDPETVKTARSLIAFGALGRARGAATAAASDSEKKGTDADKTPAVVNDAKQGFAASATDGKADTSKIPDPAGFGATEATADAKATDQPAPTTKDVKPASTTPAPGAAASAASSPSTPTTNPQAPSAHLNPFMLLGVPFGAAILLIGIYWLILRLGAV